MEGVPPTHTVGMADMGKLVVLEGAEYWACVRVEAGGLEWVVVTACRLKRQQSRGPACYRVFKECLRSLGPVRRAHRCTTGDIPQAAAVFVEVTRPPKVQGQDVWRVAASNMWQAEHAAAMCRALQGQAAALPRAPAAQSSSNRPAASLALPHTGSRAWCWVAVALEPHSSALRVINRGEGTALTVRPADLEALHLGALSGDGGTALYLQGTVVGSAAMRFRRHSGRDALRLVMAANMGPWLRAFSTSRWKVGGRPGEVRRRLAALGGGAVSRGGDAAPTTVLGGSPRAATSSIQPRPGADVDVLRPTLLRGQFAAEVPQHVPNVGIAAIPVGGALLGKRLGPRGGGRARSLYATPPSPPPPPWVLKDSGAGSATSKCP